MAARYWVGGSGNWNTSETTHWSATSGGSGGATIPTAADDVIFDANSGGGTATVSSGRPCKSLSTSGFSGVISGVTILVSGSVLIAPETNLILSSQLSIRETGSLTITQEVGFIINASPATASMVLDILSDLTFSADKSLISSGGVGKTATINTNGHTLSFSGALGRLVVGSTTYVGIVNLGSSICTFQSPTPITKNTNGVLNAGTSTLKFGNTTGTITLPAFTYYNIEFTGEVATVLFLDAAINCNSIKFKAGCAYSLYGDVASGLTIYCNSINAVGTSGSMVTLAGASPDLKLTFSVPSGTVNCDYLSLTNSVATGGATFVAGANSVDNGGNEGWFGSTPSGYGNTVAGIAASNIASIAGVAKANISKVGGV